MSWLLKDYGLSRIEDVPTNIQYSRISRQWYEAPPVAMLTPPAFLWLPSKVQVGSQGHINESWVYMACNPRTEIYCGRMQGNLPAVFLESCSPQRPCLLPSSSFCKSFIRLMWAVECDYRRKWISLQPPRIFVTAQIVVSAYAMGETGAGDSD